MTDAGDCAELYRRPKGDSEGVAKPYSQGTSTKAYNKRSRKPQYRNVRATQEVKLDDWKQDLLSKIKSLEQAQQAADASTKKLAAENVALNKEVRS